MIWQAPWAWLGLAALVIPVAVHLLTRRQARRVAFPTLRFLVASESSSIRRHRLTDLALLAVRAAVIAAATAALAQPYVALPARVRGLASTLSRVVVVDASASMLRAAGPATALAAARTQAGRLQPAASTTSTIESGDLRAALAMADAWLAGLPGRREIAILSDFQERSIELADLQAVPASTGLRLIKVETTAPALVSGPVAHLAGRRVTPQIAACARWLDVRWVATPETAEVPDGLKVLSGPSERVSTTAALQAALTAGVLAGGPDRLVVIALPEAAERAPLLAQSHPINEPWMFAVASRLNASAGGRGASTSSGVVSGRVAQLIFPMSSEPVALADIVTAALGASAAAAPLTELEPLSIPADTLRQWERPPVTQTMGAGAANGVSDGRWLWALALALLGLETWMRASERVRA